MTTYRLVFKTEALKEWNKLDSSIQSQLQKKLRERLQHPRITASKLHGMPDCYKIKLKKPGYRLIYRVDDNRIVLLVISVGKRDGGEAYEQTAKRLD